MPTMTVDINKKKALKTSNVLVHPSRDLEAAASTPLIWDAATITARNVTTINEARALELSRKGVVFNTQKI